MPKESFTQRHEGLISLLFYGSLLVGVILLCRHCTDKDEPPPAKNRCVDIGNGIKSCPPDTFYDPGPPRPPSPPPPPPYSHGRW